MKVVNREDITDKLYREILDVETHHDHKIIEDESGTLRWEVNPATRFLVDEVTDLNNTVMKLYGKGHDKNSELYRKLYRDIGYSLYGYWEIFYWEMNNEEVAEYAPNTK
jgi:hypothetical protein